MHVCIPPRLRGTQDRHGTEGHARGDRQRTGGQAIGVFDDASRDRDDVSHGSDWIGDDLRQEAFAGVLVGDVMAALKDALPLAAVERQLQGLQGVILVPLLQLGRVQMGDGRPGRLAVGVRAANAENLAKCMKLSINDGANGIPPVHCLRPLFKGVQCYTVYCKQGSFALQP